VSASWSEEVRTAQAEIAARRARPGGRTVGDAPADPIAIIRIRWNGRRAGLIEYRYDITAYSDHHQRILLDRPEQLQHLTEVMRSWPGADWCRDWDYRAADGHLTPAPDVCDLGGIPEEDHSFGPHHSPMGAVA
jgi:hypothetical protein